MNSVPDAPALLLRRRGPWLDTVSFAETATIMAAEEGYDPRRETLVMETRTVWDPALGDLSEADRDWLARAVHEQPDKAAKIGYERSHTGFLREITVTVADVERLYREKAAAH